MKLLLRLLVCCFLFPSPVFSQWLDVSPEVANFFPTATRIKAADDQGVISVYQLNQQIGLVFESDQLVNFPGFSGDTINLRLGLDMQGMIKGVKIVRHHEPIFLHGLGEAPLFDFINQYAGKHIKHRFIVGSRQSKLAVVEPNFRGNYPV